MLKPLIVLVLGLCVSATAAAADRVTVGFISTFVGPFGVIGADLRDGFNLAVKLNGGRLGGLPAEVIVADDAGNPEVGKQVAERMIKRDKVQLITGMASSAVLLPVMPQILASETFYLSPNTGPQDYAGEKCNPYFFAVAWQNEDMSAAAGKFVTEKGFKNVHLVAPNYPGGRETLNGFKRTYKGKYQEIYTKLGQLDFGVELTELRTAKPDAVFIFLPGGMGVSFIKQFVASGLSKDIQLFVPGFNADEDTIKSLGDTMLGTFNTSHWAHDLDNLANRKFVAAFQKEFGRLPTMYAAQAYDTGLLMDAAIRDVKGRVEDKKAMRKALEAARFDAVRGSFRFNKNHYPIHDIYMRIVSKDASGRVTNRTLGKIASSQADPFAAQCRMAN